MAARSDLWGDRHTQDRVHLGDASRHRREKIADLTRYVRSLEIGVPIDAVLALDVAGVDMNELHFLHDEARSGDDVGLDGEIVQVFEFDPRGRFDLGETPSAARQAFEYIGSYSGRDRRRIPPRISPEPPDRRLDPVSARPPWHAAPALAPRECRLARAALRQRLPRSRPRVSCPAQVPIVRRGHANPTRAAVGTEARRYTLILRGVVLPALLPMLR